MYLQVSPYAVKDPKYRIHEASVPANKKVHKKEFCFGDRSIYVCQDFTSFFAKVTNSNDVLIPNNQQNREFTENRQRTYDFITHALA